MNKGTQETQEYRNKKNNENLTIPIPTSHCIGWVLQTVISEKGK